MKIAIQGHPTRGKEVIQILESLGGINIHNYSGLSTFKHYIDSFNKIDITTHLTSDWKIYTLEEFEKEFPFKIGDKIMDCSDNEVGTIIDLIYIDNGFFYNVDFVNSGQAFMPSEQLKPYKEMKEERNITLTLDKAKEWYKKGGDLKQVALQAFSEKELTKVDLPKTWVEFCEDYMINDNEAYFDTGGDIHIADINCRDSQYDKTICPSEKSAEAHLAMIQLEQLRNCWWGNWKPEWSNSGKYVIKWEGNNLIVFTARRVHAFLVFPTREIAEEFLKCFRDLIEKAGDLI